MLVKKYLIGTPLAMALAFALIPVSIATTGCGGETVDPADAGPTDGGPGGTLSYEERCSMDDMENDRERPAGWRAASHCKYAPPNYEKVFGDGTQILELQLRMKGADYTAMKEDLSELLGGGVGGVGGVVPQSWIDACTGIAQGDACENSEGTGSCEEIAPDTLACLPGGGGGIPQSWIDACNDLAPGDACMSPDGAGKCETVIDILVCSPGEGVIRPLDPCKDKQDGDPCKISQLDGRCVKNQENARFISCAVRGFTEASVADVPDDAAAKFFSRKPNYFPADVVIGEERWMQVGLRYKGNNGLASSFAPKRPLRIKMDKYEDENPALDDQRLHGFKDLSFTNNQTDTTFLSQHATASTFRKMGTIAPRTTPASISLVVDDDDPILLGLYTLTEIPAKPLLDDGFGEHGGNLYKPDGRGAHFLSYVEASYHKKNHKMEADFGDMRAFVEALNDKNLPAQDWRTALEKRFNMSGYIQFMATNQAIANWDTYGGFAHNFYFYGEKDGGRLNFIPWDFDLAMANTGESDFSLRSFDGKWPLIQAVVHDPVYYYEYHKHLLNAYDSMFGNNQLSGDIAGWAAAISPVASAETSTEAFNAATDGTIRHVEAQKVAIAEYLRARGFDVP